MDRFFYMSKRFLKSETDKHIYFNRLSRKAILRIDKKYVVSSDDKRFLLSCDENATCFFKMNDAAKPVELKIRIFVKFLDKKFLKGG